MKVHDNSGEVITFRAFVGSGEFRGMSFDLCVSAMPDGTLTGLPIIDFKDENSTSVTFELEDLLPKAYMAAFGNVKRCEEVSTNGG